MNLFDRGRLRCLPASTLATLLAVALSACAAGPATKGDPVAHLCKPTEEVGFSCELQDGRLLSMCASAGFAKFDGNPNDNPGYAYLALGTRTGEVQASYPPDPRDYKSHFHKGVSAHLIPYFFVTSEKGEFFFVTEQDFDDPQGAASWTPHNLPNGWSINANGGDRACVRVLKYNFYVSASVPFDFAWKEKQRLRLEVQEKAKAKQP